MIGFGQNVTIPDSYFKAYLVGNTAINTNGDTEIQLSEAAAFNGAITCAGLGISNLTGIEAFTALTALYCYYNQLTSLDVSQNTALTVLDCASNQLSNLDVSQNTALDELWCDDNNLTSLDVSGANALTELYCDGNQLTSLDVSSANALNTFDCSRNQLTSLDVSQNTALTELDCYENQLKCLDISYNIILDEVGCYNNILEQLNTRNGVWAIDINAEINNLTCVEVDNIGYATANWGGSFDSFVSFSTNCNYTTPCVTVSAIQEHTTNKELLKITNLLGRETKATNQLLFYLYDDGTVEKKIIIE